MLQISEKIPRINADTNIVGAYMQLTGCTCNCVDCNGCKDCVYCANLGLDDILMSVYRKGVKPDKSYFVQYMAHYVIGNKVDFFIDSLLNQATPGYYVGDVFIRGNPCGSIEMLVGDNNTVFSPYSQ